MNRFGKTVEGVRFWAFVENPAEMVENPALCHGKTVKEWLNDAFKDCFKNNNLIRYGCYKIFGWCFDLRPYLKKYIYTCCGSIYTAWAPSVALLRSVRCLSRSERVALAPKGF